MTITVSFVHVKFHICMSTSFRFTLIQINTPNTSLSLSFFLTQTQKEQTCPNPQSPVSGLHHCFDGGGLFDRGWDWGTRLRCASLIYNMAFYRRNLRHTIRVNASARLDQTKWCETIFDGIFRRGSFKPVLCFGGFCANLSTFGFGRRDPRNIGYFGGAHRGHLV